ncbi:MAG: alpha-E domain-containing protein [Motiliproteus sp.]|nr:alpha-E domain-containing protein [Motiliproteus sp.]MCW9053849.1 alpha-E domain-containing protein [Motiliproteus sp.]
MLSKVAERLYWTARYLERVENTARLVSVYDSLLFDLPREIDISWYNLVTLNSAEKLYQERYRVQDERNVVKFLLADDTNPSSMLSALWMLRENVRTTRDVLPQDTWELVNELHIFAKDNIQQGINRSGRHRFLDQLIKGCQQINGLLIGTMSRDASWQFLRLGRNLERADMVTRLLDAGTAAQIEGESDTRLQINQVIWGNVLRSSSADMNYRRTMRSAVSATEVAAFLLEDSHFPRSLHFCLSHMLSAVETLPNGRAVGKHLDRILKYRYVLDDHQPLGEEFRDYLNQLQLELNDLHSCFNETWFGQTQKGDA